MWLTRLGLHTNSIIRQLMNHVETPKNMLSLHRFDLFRYQLAFGAQWMKKHLHNVSGGVNNNMYSS